MSDSRVKIEVHLIQNFAPSNLNRDDTGQPKSATFGGFRRARMSSQAANESRDGKSLWPSFLKSGEQCGRGSSLWRSPRPLMRKDEPDQKTIDVVAEVFKAGGLERPGEDSAEPKNTTKILLFIDKDASPELKKVFKDNWADLTNAKEKTKETVDKIGKIFSTVKAPGSRPAW